jgi:hypothetical protein
MQLELLLALRRARRAEAQAAALLDLLEQVLADLREARRTKPSTILGFRKRTPQRKKPASG